MPKNLQSLKQTLVLVTVALAAIVLIAVFHAMAGTGLHSESEMKAKLDTAIPRGTPVQMAQTELSRLGFKVSQMRNSSFVDQDEVRQHLDYLYGDMSEGAIIKRRWQVAAVYRDGEITEIIVNAGLQGP